MIRSEYSCLYTAWATTLYTYLIIASETPVEDHIMSVVHRMISILLLMLFFSSQTLAQCGGTSGYCCLSQCNGQCVNAIGEEMCRACAGNCDFTVCTCGCDDSGLHCAGEASSGAGKRCDLPEMQTIVPGIGLSLYGLWLAH